MKYTLLSIFLLTCFCLHAQDTTQQDGDKEFSKVQVEAKFPGGQIAWQEFLQQHIHARVPAKHKAPPGNYTVTMSFLVDKTGKVTDVKALNDPGYGTAQDAVNAFKHTPDWIPAMQNGKPVIYRQKQNITYQVTER